LKDTPFECGKKPISSYVRAMQMYQMGMTAVYVARMVGCSLDGAISWEQYFRFIGSVGTGLLESDVIFELRQKKTGKLITQSSTLQSCLREAGWNGGKFRADAKSEKFYIRKIERQGWGGFSSRSPRYGRRWPARKLAEFRIDWLSGMRLVDLEKKYDCGAPTIKRAINRLRSRFDPAHDTAMLYMLKEGMTIDEIAEHFQRAPDSLVRRLEYICPEETKSRLTRAKRQWAESNRALRKEERTRARQDRPSVAKPEAASSNCGIDFLDGLNLPPSALAQIVKQHVRWNEARRRLSRAGAVLQPQ
jgi:hypothetical protein